MTLYYDVVADDDLGCLVAVRDGGPHGEILALGFDVVGVARKRIEREQREP